MKLKLIFALKCLTNEELKNKALENLYRIEQTKRSATNAVLDSYAKLRASEKLLIDSMVKS